jgi:hypothetical protein
MGALAEKKRKEEEERMLAELRKREAEEKARREYIENDASKWFYVKAPEEKKEPPGGKSDEKKEEEKKEEEKKPSRHLRFTASKWGPFTTKQMWQMNSGDFHDPACVAPEHEERWSAQVLDFRKPVVRILQLSVFLDFTKHIMETT